MNTLRKCDVVTEKQVFVMADVKVENDGEQTDLFMAPRTLLKQSLNNQSPSHITGL